MESMDRETLLKNLKNIRFVAFLTDLTSEYCLEVNILNSKGTSYSWIAYDEWNIYRLDTSNRDKWTMIRKKIRDMELIVSDLDNTALGYFIKGVLEEDDSDYNCSELVAGLLDLPEEIEESIYCYYDADNSELFFFANQNEFADYLAGIYTDANTLWDEMATDDLEYWWSRIEDEGMEIPCMVFEDKDG